MRLCRPRSSIIVASEERSLSPPTDRIEDLVADATLAPDDMAWREAFRRGFAGLRANLHLHPADSTAAGTFEAAAATARDVAVNCLPLGIAIVMHLYPLCVLRCVPLPWWRRGALRRSRLLRIIDTRALILSNAGSERTTAARAPVILTRTHDGIRVDGTYAYVSLANVADLVRFGAPLADSNPNVFFPAVLRGESVATAGGRFDGRRRPSAPVRVPFTTIAWRPI